MTTDAAIDLVSALRRCGLFRGVSDARLHTLVAEAQPSFPADAIAGAVDHVLQLEGRGDARRLADIWEVER